MAPAPACSPKGTTSAVPTAKVVAVATFDQAEEPALLKARVR